MSKQRLRVLVLSSTAFSDVTATGSALVSLFKGWNRDDLAQVHCQKNTDRHEICASYHVFGQWDDTLRGFVKSFDPDVIYYRTIDRPDAFRSVALQIHEHFGTPIVTHTMDDWIGRLRKEENDQSSVKRAETELTTTIRAAAANLTISDQMARSMERQYHRPFRAFANSIDLHEWSQQQRARSFATDGVFSLRYTGSLASDMCLASAVDIATSVAELRREGIPVVFEHCSARYWKADFDEHIGHLDGSFHRGELSRSGLLQFVLDADLAVLPINFDERSLAYIGDSMSKKAPDYMAAGLPILAYGPLKSATIADAAFSGWAHVLSARDTKELTAVLRKLIASPSRRAALMRRSTAHGLAFKDGARSRKKFREVLATAASC